MALSNASEDTGEIQESGALSEIAQLIAGQQKDEDETSTGEDNPEGGKKTVEEEAETEVEVEVEVDPETDPETEAETEDEAKEGEKEEEGTEGEISSVKDFVAATGWEMEDFYALQINLKGSGEAMTIGELKDAVQDIPNQKAAFEQEKTEFKEQVDTWKKTAESNMQQLVGLPEEVLNAEADIRSLVHQFGAVDWARFEKDEPGKAALAKQKMEEAYQAASQKKAQALNIAQRSQQNALLERRTEEAKQVMIKVPAWKEQKVFSTALDGMDALLMEYGYPKGSIGQVMDHRQLLMMNELMGLKAKMTTSKDNLILATTKKKPVKVLKAGSNVAKRKILRKKADEASKERAKSGGNREKVGYITNLLAGK